jgi:hypothetical protein
MKRPNTRGMFDEAGVTHLRFLANCNLMPAEIAMAMGCAPGTVYTMCARYHITLGDPNVMHVPLRAEINNLIRIEAERRNVSRSRLLARILTIIATDNLFNAVLGAPATAPKLRNEERTTVD